MSSRRCALVAWLAVLALPGLSTPQALHDSTDVVLVRIPVSVTENGEPVRGLGAENFVVVEKGRRHPVVSFDVFDLDLVGSGSSTGGPVPAAERRRFLMLFDLANSEPVSIDRARQAAFDLASRGFAPTDLVAVAKYTRSGGVEVLLSFSSDRDQLIAALAGLGVVEPFERVDDPLQLVVMDQQQIADNVVLETIEPGQMPGGTAQAPGGGKMRRFTGMLPEVVMLEQLEDTSSMVDRVGRDTIKQQVADLAASLEELGLLMASIRGRKQILLFSEGFDSSVVFGTQDVDALRESATQRDYGRLWRVDSEERFGASDSQLGLMAVLETLRRSDCVIQAVDIGGLRAGGDVGQIQPRAGNQTVRREGLFVLANETGGRLYKNANDLTDGMAALLEETRVSYQVGIQPANLAFDGAYHRIKVKLRGVPKSYEIHHSPGYYAPRRYAELLAEERRLRNAELIVGGDPGGLIEIGVLALPFESVDLGTRVVTAVEISGQGLSLGSLGHVLPLEIYTYAMDSRGGVQDFFTQAVELDLHKVGHLMKPGFKLLGDLVLPAGTHELRVLVRNARTGSTGLSVSSVDIPAAGDDAPFLLPPLFIDAEGRWLVAHAARDGVATLGYPLMMRGARLVPAARPSIATGREIPILIIGRELPGAPRIGATLSSADGTIRRRVDLAVDDELRSAQHGVQHFLARLEVDGVEPGYYRLSLATESGFGAERVGSSIWVAVDRPWNGFDPSTGLDDEAVPEPNALARRSTAPGPTRTP